MMLGNNGREISVFRPKPGAPAAPGGKGGEKSGGSFGGDAVKETIRTFYGSATPLVAAFYLVDTALHRTEAADSWINDVVCACPAMAMATLHAATAHPAYVYQFLRSIPGKGEATLGSFHSLELPYVFAAFHLPAWNWLPFQPLDFALGEQIQS